MSRLLATSRRLAFGVVAFGLVAGLTANARAEQAYAFATETISGLIGTPTNTAVTLNLDLANSLFTNTNDSAGVNGANVVNVDPLDANIAYVGPAPAPANNTPTPGLSGNFFAKFATFGGDPTTTPGLLPVTPLSSFGRGDVLITGTPNTASSLGTVVGEAYAKGLGQTAFGQGQNQISVSFTLTGTPATSTVAIKYNYANDIYTAVANVLTGDKAQANYKFAITITDPANNVIFLSQTDATNNGGIKSPPNGVEIVRSGSETVTTPALTIGTKYNLIFSLQAAANVQTAVPEPATMAMALTALPLLGLGLVRRRNRKAQA